MTETNLEENSGIEIASRYLLAARKKQKTEQKKKRK